MTFPTLTEQKRAHVAAMRQGFATLCEALRSYARARGGRFIVFGSAAEDRLRFDSDIDILVDFPETSTSEARRFAEGECRRLGLTPDVRPALYCKPEFVARVLKDGLVLE